MSNLGTQLHSKWMNGSLIMYPQSFGLGMEYCVDKNSGSDTNSGLDWDNAFATVAAAITASNLTCGNYNMNNIYVNAQTYSEAQTVLPKNCNVIGVGARTRLTGAHTFAATSQNCHFWNIWFRGSGAYPLVTIPSTCYGVGFHGCHFEGTASATYALSWGSTNDAIIEDCIFQGNPLFPTAIDITALQIRLVIKNNWIGATTNGIQIFNGTGCYGNLIYNNIIGRIANDPNSSEQLAYGIKMNKNTGTAKYQIVNNRIEAADGIYSATSDTHFQNQCIGNIVNEAGVSDFEDAMPKT